MPSSSWPSHTVSSVASSPAHTSGRSPTTTAAVPASGSTATSTDSSEPSMRYSAV